MLKLTDEIKLRIFGVVRFGFIYAIVLTGLYAIFRYVFQRTIIGFFINLFLTQIAVYPWNHIVYRAFPRLGNGWVFLGVLFFSGFLVALCFQGLIKLINTLFKKMHQWDIVLTTLISWAIIAFFIGHSGYFINTIKPGFYFEKYDSSNTFVAKQKALNALKKRHPFGSPVEPLVSTLKKAGAKIEFKEQIYSNLGQQTYRELDAMGMTEIVVNPRPGKNGSGIGQLGGIKCNIEASYSYEPYRWNIGKTNWGLVITEKNKKIIFYSIYCLDEPFLNL
jgi:hypothetical protein